ncbi:hypothetical protein ACT91Q_10430 [Brevibacillus thermoruber]|jgi:hypothetical protein|uniref:hypothetical protein n=1 Tax=Brevibacillus thermoruber TaxID=33942 RepID=UPI004043946B
MNLYILVEGKSEKYIYPAWLKLLLPNLVQVDSPFEVEDNNYYLFSSFGIPSVISDIPKAIEDMNQIGKFDFLIVVLDADELTVEERKQEVWQKVREEGLHVGDSRIIIVVQNRCIETWCLGNRKVYSRQPTTHEFIECTRFYNVNDQDPELMERDTNICNATSIAQYHEYYLRKMLRERNIKYRKGKGTKAVQEPHYLNELIARISSTNHLSSFRSFIEVIERLKILMETTTQIAISEEVN